MSRLIFIIALIMSAQTSQAQSRFQAPEEFTFENKVYKLNFSKKQSYEIYEYTTDGETVNNWTTLITFIYAKNLKATATDWVNATKKSLDSRTPKPHYSLYAVSDNAYAIQLYEPIPSDLSYEATIKKAFFIEACNGPLDFAFAKRYPSLQEESGEAQKTKLVGIAQEAQKRIKELETATWKPTCAGSTQ
jgi:hypothetical protein